MPVAAERHGRWCSHKAVRTLLERLPNEEIGMKGSRELKHYVAKYRDHLKRCRWDDLFVFKELGTSKNWFKRKKRVEAKEFDE